MRSFALAVLAVLIGTILGFALVEASLRLLPVSEGLRAMPVNSDNPVYRFTPDRTVVWSRDWNFSIVNEIRVNNAGFVNDQDYTIDDTPLLAVIGDSYIEAAMVPYPETLQGRTARAAGEAGRVYSFAASGAPLSQYVVWAREAREVWKADALAVVVVGNDFDESLAANKSAPGFHYYAAGPQGELELRRRDYHPRPLRRFLRHSALFRYLALNLHALERLPAVLGRIVPAARADTFIGNTAAEAGKQRLADSRRVVDAFLRDLVSLAGWQPEDVVLLVDGIRYPSEDPAVAASYFVRMRDYLMQEAQARGFTAINLDPHFFARHRRDGSRFEFPTDGHWNALAHGIAAEALTQSPFFRGWKERSAAPGR